MIDKTTFDVIKKQYHFLSSLPDKLQELISYELSPDDQISTIKKVTIGGKDGCLVFAQNRLVAFWMSRLLFKKFPTLQEFYFTQIDQLEEIGTQSLFIHACADSLNPTENYEEGEFVFESVMERVDALRLIKANSPQK